MAAQPQTNREALIDLTGFNPSANSVSKVLIDAGVDGDLIYDGTYKEKLDQCAIKLIEIILSTPDQTNENGFAIKYDRKAVMDKLAILKNDGGEVLVKRNIYNASNMW